MPFDPSELLAKSPLSIVICDQRERILWCNTRFLKETRLSEDSIVGKLYPSLPLEAIDNNAQVVQLFNEQLREPTKFHYWQENLTNPEQGKAHFFTLQRQSKQQKTLASLKLNNTKLPKRASWVEFLDYEVSRSRRYDNPLSILKLHLVIIDKIPSTNEDTLQQTIKDTLMDELRWADMIGHTDHGSFLIVLPETPADSLNSLKSKLKQAINKQIEFIDREISYQLVFGEACWQKHDDSQSMLKRAREKLVEGLEKILADSK